MLHSYEFIFIEDDGGGADAKNTQMLLMFRHTYSRMHFHYNSMYSRTFMVAYDRCALEKQMNHHRLLACLAWPGSNCVQAVTVTVLHL